MLYDDDRQVNYPQQRLLYLLVFACFCQTPFCFSPLPHLYLFQCFLLCLLLIDPFAEASKAQLSAEETIHVRIQQRNGRKTLTTIQGISSGFDKKKIVKACKKEFACNGTVVEHPEYGEVIQFQGDQRNNICQFLLKTGIAKPQQLKVHGF